MRGYEKLAADIVKHAIIDYRKACLDLRLLTDRGAVMRLTNRAKYERKHNQCLLEIKSIEQFIASPYFGILTSMNPELLLKTLREEKRRYECQRILKSGERPQ